jgi:hypothetical protein
MYHTKTGLNNDTRYLIMVSAALVSFNIDYLPRYNRYPTALYTHRITSLLDRAPDSVSQPLPERAGVLDGIRQMRASAGRAENGARNAIP